MRCDGVAARGVENRAELRAPVDIKREFEAGLDRAAWRKVRGYAFRRLAMLYPGGSVEEWRVDELVSDAVGDTAMGVCRWDPARCALTTHLCGIIRSRTHKALRRRPVTFVEFDECATAAANDETPEVLVGRVQVVQRFLVALYEAAEDKGDMEALWILDLYRDGVCQRSEIARELKISPKKYDHARARLVRLAASLPADVRDEALEIMRMG